MVHESQDKRPQAMTVSSGFPASGVPTLPSFRELLPDYLHDEIDRAASRSQPDHQQGGGSCSSPRQNLPLRHRTTPRSDHPSTRPPSRDPRYDDVSSRPDRFMSSGDHSRYHGSPTLPRAHPLGSKGHHTSSRQSPHGYPPRGMNRSLPPIPNLQTSPSDTRSPFSNSSDRSPSSHMPLHRPMKKESERELFAHSSTSPSSMFGSPSPLEPPNLYPTPPLSLPKPMEPTGQLSPYSPYPPTSYSSEREYSPRLSNNMHSSTLGSPGDSGSDMREKKRRGNLPKQVTDMLRAWLWEHLEHPYPSEEDKQMFIHQTGLTINQISNWFINARRRQLPGLREQAQNGSTEGTRNSSPMNSDSGRESTDMYHTRLSDA